MAPNVTSTGTMTNRQLMAVAALAAGATYQMAAKKAGCSKRTVLRWSERPDFRSAVAAARTAAFARTLTQLETAAGEAVAALRALARITATRAAQLGPAARLRGEAARALLAVALRAHEDLSVAERLDALERRRS